MEPHPPAGSEPLDAADDIGGAAEPRSARLFVGVKIASEIASALAQIAGSLEDPSVRLVPASDIHLTLAPPWSETNVAAAADTLRNALQPIGAFTLAFEHLSYGPSPRAAKFLWTECAATNELDLVRKLVLSAFNQTEERPFRPHVTLARLGRNGREIARKQPIDRRLSFSQAVRSIELFRSPQQRGRGYEVVASIPLHEGAPARLAQPGATEAAGRCDLAALWNGGSTAFRARERGHG